MSILPINQGGTGTATPALVAGTNIALTNPFPNMTIGLSGVVGVANGGTGSGTQNFVDLSTNQAAIAGNKTFNGLTKFGAKTFSGTTQTGGFYHGLTALGTKRYNVDDYGADGSGATDSSSAIQAALADAVAGNGILFFPPNNYLYNSATPLTLSSGQYGIEGGGAFITGGALATDCFIITGVGQQYQSFRFPSIYNFKNGRGLTLLGALGCDVWVPRVSGCSIGISIESDSGHLNANQNIIRNGKLDGCTVAGLQVKTTANGQAQQGNYFYSNYISNCDKGIYYNVASTDNLVVWNYYEVDVIFGEFNNARNQWGIYASGQYLSTTFHIRNVFDAFSTSASSGYIHFTAGSTGKFRVILDNQIAGTAGPGGTAGAQYATFQLGVMAPRQIPTSTSSIRSRNQTAGQLTSPPPRPRQIETGQAATTAEMPCSQAPYARRSQFPHLAVSLRHISSTFIRLWQMELLSSLSNRFGQM